MKIHLAVSHAVPSLLCGVEQPVYYTTPAAYEKAARFIPKGQVCGDCLQVIEEAEEAVHLIWNSSGSGGTISQRIVLALLCLHQNGQERALERKRI